MQQLRPSREGEEFACFLTEPHPVDVEARKRVCLDVLAQYCQGYRVLIKPHPRDTIDYEALCPDAVVLRGRFPVEVLNFFEGLRHTDYSDEQYGFCGGEAQPRRFLLGCV